MVVALLKLTFYAPWVHSLKEKRMIVKSLCAKLHNRFNVSVIEADCQDIHQTIVIAVACVADTNALCDSMFDHVLSFVEESCEAQLTEVEREER